MVTNNLDFRFQRYMYLHLKRDVEGLIHKMTGYGNHDSSPQENIYLLLLLLSY